jgi:hypothetical protein
MDGEPDEEKPRLPKLVKTTDADDPYLNPAKLTHRSGPDPILRWENGTLVQLSDDEAAIVREQRHPKKLERPRVYPRGNRWL